MYALLQVCAIIALLLLGITLFIVSVKKAGANLHKQILRTLMRAPLLFLTRTDTGVVTNLFSQDLNLIDTELPDATLNTLFCVSCLFVVFCTGDYSDELHADISMPRTSGRDVDIVIVSSHQLSHSRCISLRCAKILLENLSPVEAA